MSDDWIEGRLEKQFANDIETLSDIKRALKKGQIDKVLIKIDESGKITTKKLNDAAKLIGDWP